MPRCAGALTDLVMKSHNPYKKAGPVFITDREGWGFHVSLAFSQILDEGKQSAAQGVLSRCLVPLTLIPKRKIGLLSINRTRHLSKPESSISHHRYSTLY